MEKNIEYFYTKCFKLALKSGSLEYEKLIERFKRIVEATFDPQDKSSIAEE